MFHALVRQYLPVDNVRVPNRPSNTAQKRRPRERPSYWQLGKSWKNLLKTRDRQTSLVLPVDNVRALSRRSNTAPKRRPRDRESYWQLGISWKNLFEDKRLTSLVGFMDVSGPEMRAMEPHVAFSACSLQSLVSYIQRQRAEFPAQGRAGNLRAAHIPDTRMLSTFSKVMAWPARTARSDVRRTSM